MQEYSNAQRAEVLIQALPYIRKYNGKIIVVKYGGNAMTGETLKQQVMEDVALLQLVGVKVVLVHGGGPELTRTLAAMGKTSVFVDGLRVTDRQTADAALMVLAGKVNKGLVNLLQLKGGRAIGLCGLDGRLLEAAPLDERLGFAGRVTAVRPQIVLDALEKGYIPVISTVGGDADGNVYNINADTAAAWIAGAIHAERLFTMTDIAGILADPGDPGSLIPRLTVREAAQLFRRGVISGGMIPKVDCCIEAIGMGVKKVIVMDGRIPHAILLETLTDEGAGTMLTEEEEYDEP